MAALPYGLDSNTFQQNGNGTFSYSSGNNATAIPTSYFTGGMYQQDMNQYGQAMGPGGIFMQNGGTWNGAGYDGSGDASSFDPNLYTQNDQGQIVGWSGTEGARRSSIDQAYQSLMNGNSATTSFTTPGQPPQQLGSDVFTSLANGGLWMPTGSDVSNRNQNIEARIGQDGNIVVRDPRGGDGQNPVYIYGPDGKFIRQEVGSKVMSPLMGVASVGLAALGMGAMGAATGAGGLGAGMGEAGAAGAAGAGEAGGTASALGGSGAATGTDLNAFFGGLDNGATLGGGASINGGAALGSLGGGFSLPSTGNSLIDQLIKQVGSKGIQGLLGGSGATGTTGTTNQGGGSVADPSNSFLNSLTNLIPGLVSANQQGQAGQSMVDWLGGQQSKIDNLYNPGSPEYNSLWNEMSRKDAAAGRNSQYGPRSVDLAGKIAGIKGGLTTQFTTGTSRALSDALTQNANRFDSLLGGLGMLNSGSSGLSGLIKSLTSGVGGSSISSGLSSILGGQSGTSLSNDQILNMIGQSGGNPIDYAAGASSPTEQDVLDFMNQGGGFSGADTSSDIFDWFL